MIKIGFFDSGIGGLSILREVDNLLPSAQFYYLTDPKFMPYGNKRPEEILNRSSVLVEELLKEGCDHIVVACNTATAIAIDFLRQKYSEALFIGVEPYVNVINKTPELEKPVLLLTESMAKTERFQRLKETLDPLKKIDVYPCRELATIAERAFYEGVDGNLIKEIQAELAPLKEQGHTHAILGCTHYNFLRDIIAEFLQLECICPGDHVAKRVKSLIDSSGQKTSPRDGFHFKNIEQKNWQYWPKNNLYKVLACD
ncbi:MAG: hypothetical protein DRQ88_08680 [Epsilonproteobacteria bacterium]|nr:MAG: hypothetical protein DRQ89_08195 [Campylobacterota bacterium]RLA65765.1 MAG: hypothetical protein DRQ88_08680 [Campylobacterota bacterium]